VLPTFPRDRSASAQRQLERLGATVRTGTRVVGIDDRGVDVEMADGRTERIPARTTLWAAGILVSSFVAAVAEATGAPHDRSGRLIVGPDLTVPGHPEIFAVGDTAVQPWKPDHPVPGVAQGAIQGGRYAARAIRGRLSGEPLPPFRYSNRGEVAVIGRLAGVTDIPWLGPLGRQSGFIAWALWLFIHILYLVGFANRIVVTIRWAWSFLTHGRGSRLITGVPSLPPIAEPEPPATTAPPAGPPPAPSGGSLPQRPDARATPGGTPPENDEPAPG
jgi:NADH:ubiquinone reductase (H+-translocating)